MNTEKDPVLLFQAWHKQALEAGIKEPGTMTLATVGRDGRPSARIVLFKEFDRKGITFYTNFRSRKSCDINGNKAASVVVYWEQLGYQVRIEGNIEKITDHDSDLYFSTRPRGSQLGAWVSDQSSEIPSRTYLEQEMERLKKKYEGKKVPRPHYWGGYRLVPDHFEFWKKGDDRLHDRIGFEKDGERWNRRTLAP